MKQSKWVIRSLFAGMVVLFSVTQCAEQLTELSLEVLSVNAAVNANGTLTVEFKTADPTLGVVEISSDNINFTYVYKAGDRYDTLHSITVFNLTPSTTYHYRVRAKNALGKTGFSDMATIQIGPVGYSPKIFQLHMINIPDPGDCFYIVFPNGKKMLYDAGYSSANGTIIDYLNSVGCDTIHYAVATHAHADHYGGYRSGTLPVVFPIMKFFRPASYNENTFNSVFSAIKSSNPNVTMDTLRWGNSNTNTPVLNIDPNVMITVMSAGAYNLSIDEGNSGAADDTHTNSESLAMKFTYGQARFLMTGDLEQEAYRTYIQTNAITDPVVDVLKASHHLRIDGMNNGILTATNPIIVIASTNSEGGCSGIMQCPALYNVLSFNADLYRIDAADPNLNRTKQERANAPGHVVIITDGISIQIRKQ